MSLPSNRKGRGRGTLGPSTCAANRGTPQHLQCVGEHRDLQAGSASIPSARPPPSLSRLLNQAAATANRNSTNPIPITLVYSLNRSVIHPKNVMPAIEVAVAIDV